VSRDAVAAEEDQLASCTAEQRKYFFICTVTLGPCGDTPFTSWARWQCLRGRADGLNGCYAACGCGTEYRCGALLGGDVWASCLRRWRALPLRSPLRRWRESPLAEIVPFHSADPNLPGENSRVRSFRRRFKFFSKVQIDSKRGLG
jgi:hypothetical protein